MQRVGWLYDGGFYLGVLKKHWLDGANGRTLRATQPHLCDRMAAAENMHEFMAAAAPFADRHGIGAAGAAAPPRVIDSSLAAGTADAGSVANGFGRYLSNSNPMGVAHRITVPTIIINADDDPVCRCAHAPKPHPHPHLLTPTLSPSQACLAIPCLRLPCSQPASTLNAAARPERSATNVDDNAPSLLTAGGCARTVLLRYPSGGHCCFATGWRATRFVDEMSGAFLAAMASKAAKED